jgi:hypothetical protein
MLEAQSIQIVTSDNTILPAQAVAYDLATGFGLIRPLLPMRGVKPVPLGKLEEVSQGESLMASIGAQTKGEEVDVNMTQLVSKRPFSGYWEYHIEAAAFTSPPIGNHSGAGLFNQRGELIGIGSLFVGDAMGGNRRLPGNMFVPVDLLRPILAEMQKTGGTQLSHRPWIGLSSTEQGGRVQVVRVNRDSPAKDAGLEPGDFVLAVDGEKISTLEGFYKKLWARAPESEIKLTVLQGADFGAQSRGSHGDDEETCGNLSVGLSVGLSLCEPGAWSSCRGRAGDGRVRVEAIVATNAHSETHATLRLPVRRLAKGCVLSQPDRDYCGWLTTCQHCQPRQPPALPGTRNRAGRAGLPVGSVGRPGRPLASQRTASQTPLQRPVHQSDGTSSD